MKKVITSFHYVFLVSLFLSFYDKTYSQTPARTKAIQTIQDTIRDNTSKLITPAGMRYTLYRLLDAVKDSTDIISIINLQKNTPNGIAGLDGSGKVLTSQLPAETDPTVPSWVKAITNTQISNWNTAFGWGNHAVAGYLVANITSPTSGQIIKYVSGQWVNSSASNSPDSTTASNGLSISGKDVRLGNSNLTQYTYIGGNQRIEWDNRSFTVDPSDSVLMIIDGCAECFIRLTGGGPEISSNSSTSIYGGLTVSGRVNLSASTAPLRFPNLSADPTGGNGDIYYNSALNKFRKYENFTWQDLSIVGDAAADGVTKGQATFIANDFNSSSGVISLDYNNMQVASSSQSGILNAATYNLFNKTFNSGLTNTSGVVQAGGTLLQNTLFDGGSSYSSQFSSSRTSSNATVEIYNVSSGRALYINGSSGSGIYSTNTGGIAIEGHSSNNYGVWAQSDNAPGLYAFSTNQSAAQFSVNPTTTNTIQTLVDLHRFSQSAGANNIGGSMDFYNNTNAGASSEVLSTQLVSLLSDATSTAEVGQFEVRNINGGGSPARKFAVTGPGQLIADAYGGSTFLVNDTTSYKPIAVDGSGHYVKMAGWPGGGGASYTFQNLLTESSGVVELGGTQTANISMSSGTSGWGISYSGNNTFIAGAQFSVANNADGIAIGASSGNGFAMQGNCTTGVGVYGNALGGIGVFAQATNGQALYINTLSGGELIVANLQAASTATTEIWGQFTRTSSGTAADGLGAEFQYILQSSTGSQREAAAMLVRWDDATNATYRSELTFSNADNATLYPVMSFIGRQMALPNYGGSGFTGTATKFLQVTSTGTVIQQPAAEIPTLSSNNVAPTSTPTKVGDIFVDFGNKKIYVATGTSSSTDWTILN